MKRCIDQPMNRIKIRSRLLIPLLMSLSILAGALPIAGRASAQEDLHEAPGDAGALGLDINVKAGFGKLEVSYWSGYWTPFRITITNQGPPVIGKLVVKCPSSDGPNPQYREYSKDVRIPTASRQTHEMTVFVSASDDPRVQVVAGDQVVAEAAVKVGRTYGLENQLDVLVVDNEQSALAGMASVTVERQPNRPPFGKAAAAPDPDASSAQQNAQRRYRGPLYALNQGL